MKGCIWGLESLFICMPTDVPIMVAELPFRPQLTSSSYTSDVWVCGSYCIGELKSGYIHVAKNYIWLESCLGAALSPLGSAVVSVTR